MRAGTTFRSIARNFSIALGIPLTFVAMVIVPARRANAQTFAPVEPATCPAVTEVNWQYNISSYGTGEWMAPADDLNVWWNYANNVDYLTELTANERVNEFVVRFDYFATEPVYDYLQLYSYSPDGNSTNMYLSNIVQWQGGNPVWGRMTTAWQFPRANAFIRFHSDADDNYGGVGLGRAAVCTRHPGAALGNYYRDGYAGARFSGVLLGTNDVVYFRFPVGSTKPGDQCGSAHDTFALQADPDVANDFDLYLRCGALPTPIDFTARDFWGPGPAPFFSTSVNTGFLHATTDSCPCGSYWYVAVHSYRGSGWFNLYNHKHYASQHRNTMTTSVDNDLGQSWINDIVQQLAGGFAHFFGANEGTQYFDQFTFKDEWDTDDADIQIHYDTGRPNATCSSNWYCGVFTHCTVDMFTFSDGHGTYESSVLSHELGHYLHCFGDEYDDDIGTRCGHSIMGTHWWTNNNYCYCSIYPAQQCPVGQGDHGRDGNPYYSDERNPNWGDLGVAGKSPIVITRTPDNYDFWGFDFHGLFAAPIVSNLGNQ